MQVLDREHPAVLDYRKKLKTSHVVAFCVKCEAPVKGGTVGRKDWDNRTATSTELLRQAANKHAATECDTESIVVIAINTADKADGGPVLRFAYEPRLIVRPGAPAGPPPEIVRHQIEGWTCKVCGEEGVGTLGACTGPRPEPKIIL